MAIEAHDVPGAVPDQTPTPVSRRSQLQVVPTFEPDHGIRPMAPIAEACPPAPPPEPAPWTATAEEWAKWVSERNAFADFKDAERKAADFADQEALRGTF